MCIQRNNGARSFNHCFSGKLMIVIYPEIVFVALVSSMQRACFTLLSVTYPALSYFSTLSHKWQDLRKKVIKYNTCVLIFSTTLSETFLILSSTSFHNAYLRKGNNNKNVQSTRHYWVRFSNMGLRSGIHAWKVRKQH
jgi:hypothetical protein